VRIIGSYYHFSSDDWEQVGVADVSPAGFVGDRDPMIVVIGRKKLS